MIEIKIAKWTGSFAEDKDFARNIRINKIISALEKKEEVVIDFKEVEGATQSFIHALISDVIRKYGVEILDKISFKNCNENIKKIINYKM